MDKSVSTPILLLATERSGTNLLRAIVSSHSDIASPSPFSMVDALADRYFQYMTMNDGKYFDQLIEDSIMLTQLHLNPWSVRFDIAQVKDRLTSDSFWGVFKALNLLYTESENKQHWFSKEPSLFKHTYELAYHFPEAKFVYLVRDPRDVVSSIVRGGVHEQNVYNAAIKWRDEQKIMLNAFLDPELKDRFFMLTYEDLLQDPETLIKRLMAFLQIKFEEKQLSFYTDKNVLEHSQKSEFWKNLSQPINQENSGKYKKVLSNKQVNLIESVCWSEMKVLGYQPETDSPSQISIAAKAFYRNHARVKKLIKNLSWSEESRRQKRRVASTTSIRNRMFD